MSEIVQVTRYGYELAMVAAIEFFHQTGEDQFEALLPHWIPPGLMAEEPPVAVAVFRRATFGFNNKSFAGAKCVNLAGQSMQFAWLDMDSSKWEAGGGP